MKLKIILAALCVLIAGIYPTLAQRPGAQVDGPMPPTPFGNYTPQQQKNLLLKDYSAADLIRVAGGKIYNIQQNNAWQAISGKVMETSGGVLILKAGVFDEPSLAIKNYQGTATRGLPIATLAMQSGTYNWENIPLKLYDCGTNYVPPPPTPAQIAAAKEAARKLAEYGHEKMLEAETNTVRWLLPQATNGDASAQCDLGEHYLNGQGCETNREQAIYWLQKSTAQGNLEASNKLATLKP